MVFVNEVIVVCLAIANDCSVSLSDHWDRHTWVEVCVSFFFVLPLEGVDKFEFGLDVRKITDSHQGTSVLVEIVTPYGKCVRVSIIACPVLKS